MATLVRNELITVESDSARRVLIVRRTARAPDSPDALLEAYGPALLGMDQFQGWGLLLDFRLAPGQNGADFERTLQRLRERVDDVFPRVAMVVSTVVGELHAQRLQLQRRGEWFDEGGETLVTRDYDQAMRHVAE